MPHYAILRHGKPHAGGGGGDPEARPGSLGQNAERRKVRRWEGRKAGRKIFSFLLTLLPSHLPNFKRISCPGIYTSRSFSSFPSHSTRWSSHRPCSCPNPLPPPPSIPPPGSA